MHLCLGQILPRGEIGCLMMFYVCFFKHLDDSVLDEILALFKTVWAEGYLPKEWKHAVVVPILKPGI